MKKYAQFCAVNKATNMFRNMIHTEQNSWKPTLGFALSGACYAAG